ncbi:MAG: XrtA/PEP-CTERM system amidotransferase [Rhodospirillaceae bacterium]
MCGIIGLYDGQGRFPFDPALIKRMGDAIAHRGPDGEGFHILPGIALGHRRLAVIDLAGGQQPMFSRDGLTTIVFNGEIYNFAELATELKSVGQIFRTRSDTEVILNAWAAWGPECVKRFEGMFAFALWDSRAEILFIARDRVGKKPLYYSIRDNRRLAFASELKALTTVPWISRTIDPQAVEEYLSLGYVPDPKSIYSGIAKLAPAHTLYWKRGEAPRISSYWDLDLSVRAPIGMNEAAAELDGRLSEAVKKRMTSDVPLGAFLSGGVDSSGIVAHMARLSSDPVKTCTIGFGESSHDERGYARTLADRYGTDHTERVLPSDSLTTNAGLLDHVAALYDEPFADMSAVPTYRVCGVAREKVTVALSGDGGDEAFAGYRRYRWHVREHAVRALLPQSVRGPLFSVIAWLYPKMDWAPRFLRAKSTLSELALDAVGAYFNNMTMLGDAVRLPLYSDSFRSGLQGYHASAVLKDLMAAAPSDQPLLQAQYADLKTWLAGRMLVKVDRASMANGLEVRNPFLDHELFQWGVSLPARLKLDGSEHKAVLKKALEPLVPRELLYRPKQGFTMPMAAWLRGPLLPSLQRALSSEVMLDAGYFKREALQDLVESHATGRRDHTQALWCLWMFERFLAREAGLAKAAGGSPNVANDDWAEAVGHGERQALP